MRVNYELSEEFWLTVGMQQASVLSSFLFVVAREGVLSELLYADDLVLMSETIEGLRDKFMKWKETVQNKGLIVDFGSIEVMVSGGNTKGGFSKSTVDPIWCLQLENKD